MSNSLLPRRCDNCGNSYAVNHSVFIRQESQSYNFCDHCWEDDVIDHRIKEIGESVTAWKREYEAVQRRYTAAYEVARLALDMIAERGFDPTGKNDDAVCPWCHETSSRLNVGDGHAAGCRWVSVMSANF